MPGLVSVAIPVHDAARGLERVLEAVRAQEVDREVEIVTADASGLSPGEVHNKLMRQARGDHVAMLTPDAIPASKRWLAALLEGFDQAQDVGAVFGPHPFSIWRGQGIDVQRLERTPEGIAAYRRSPSKLTFLSDMNCCLARWAWEQVPFREMPYADQLLGRELIEAGYAKVFHPEARVLYSRDHSTAERFKRYVHDFRALRQVVASRGRRSSEVPRSLMLDESAAFDPDWPWEFVRRRYPRRDVLVEPRPARASGPITISWVVPPWKVGSGGHTAIFHLVEQLERRGHSCAIYVFDSFDREKRTAHELREEIVERFVSVEARVFKGLDDFTASDVCIATNWRTAWAVRDLPGCGEKVYFVQDDEPQFYGASTQALFAEETYRMGYRCIAAHTSWMGDVLRSRYGLETHHYDCATDLDLYTFAGEEGREPGLITMYARHQTGRRAVDIAFAGVMELFERRPGIRVVLFGSRSKPSAPFPCENLGVRPPHELAALYRRASVGVVLSLTNMSLVGQEMMASGLPLVELNGPNVTSELGEPGEYAHLVEPRPDAIANALERVLDDREMAAATARRARALVEQRTWESAGDQVEAALFSFLARPRAA